MRRPDLPLDRGVILRQLRGACLMLRPAQQIHWSPRPLRRWSTVDRAGSIAAAILREKHRGTQDGRTSSRCLPTAKRGARGQSRHQVTWVSRRCETRTTGGLGGGLVAAPHTRRGEGSIPWPMAECSIGCRTFGDRQGGLLLPSVEREGVLGMPSAFGAIADAKRVELRIHSTLDRVLLGEPAGSPNHHRGLRVSPMHRFAVTIGTTSGKNDRCSTVK
jgi:hypothetical protein